MAKVRKTPQVRPPTHTQSIFTASLKGTVLPAHQGVPKAGAVKGKYAGQACVACGAVIPDRVSAAARGTSSWKGPYCSTACWQGHETVGLHTLVGVEVERDAKGRATKIVRPG